MIKASALYIVIIIALVIAVLCSAMIVAAYFYRMQYQHKSRYDVLQNNLESGISILLAADSATFREEIIISLYDNETDSVSLKRVKWGLYDVAVVKAFVREDTVYKSFMIANVLDSLKWGALYLSDEERPISLSGKTMIRGNAFLPKAGIKEAYIVGKAYKGDSRLVIGEKRSSGNGLPALQKQRLMYLKNMRSINPGADTVLMMDSLSNRFLSTTRTFRIKKKEVLLKNIFLKGNIMICSDTVVVIDSTAILENVIIVARAIVVREGFTGKCQLFATEAITLEKNCWFDYPSALGVMKFDTVSKSQPGIVIGQGVNFSGVIFTYDAKPNPVNTLIDIKKNAKISGQVFAQGMVRLQDDTEILGSVFTDRFIYQSGATLYENYLINVKIDAGKLSPYYLSSPIFPFSANTKNKILQWLELK
ncbi:MAG: hypothetical protein ACOH2A_10415 [Sphingobacteriaceae bacterium]